MSGDFAVPSGDFSVLSGDVAVLPGEWEVISGGPVFRRPSPSPAACEPVPGVDALLVLQSHILVEMLESTLVVAVAGPGLVAPPPTGPGQHSLR